MSDAATSALGVSIGSVVSLAGSVLGIALLTNRFGLSPEMDAFWMALPLPSLLGQAPTGVAWTLLIPAIAGLLSSGAHREAWSVLAAFGLTLLGAVLLVGCLLFIAATPIVAGLGPGLEAPVRDRAVFLFRMLLISGILTAVAGVLAAALNAHRVFLVPAVANASAAWGGVAGIFILSDLQGTLGFVVGLTLGALATVAIDLVALATLRPSGRYLPNWHHRHVRIASVHALPVLAVRVADQAPSLILRFAASFLPVGGVSAVGLAGTLVQPPTIVASSIVSVLFPGWAARGDDASGPLPSVVIRMTKITVWMLGGIATAGVALSPLAAAAVLSSYDVAASSGQQMLLASCFAAVSLGGPALGANYLIGAAYWASGLVGRRVRIELVFIILLAVLVIALSPTGPSGILLGQSLSFLALALFAGRALRPVNAPAVTNFEVFLVAFSAVPALVGGALYLISFQLVRDVDGIPLSVRIITIGGLATLLYGAASWLLRAQEPGELWTLVREHHGRSREPSDSAK